MEGIFVTFGAATLALLAAQLLEYIVESSRSTEAQLRLSRFSSHAPRGLQPSAEVTTWYDRAA
ncbi:MAG TPA: hypothetical protein VMD03_03585 [Steroidobacteraceae bacterium]|nr:hypothetical protein [Steroidobacteraceae bacterium]